MIADSSVWTAISQSLIAACAGLLGVSIGGWIAANNQKHERRKARIRLQLEGFYSPLLGMHAEIDAKSRLGEELHSVARSEWVKLLVDRDPQAKAQIQQERWGEFEKLIEYTEGQHREELAPLYEKMLEHFRANLWLAEPSTIRHHGELSDFVEIRRRLLAKSIPAECFRQIVDSKESLGPLYKDLDDQFARLARELRE